MKYSYIVIYTFKGGKTKQQFYDNVNTEILCHYVETMLDKYKTIIDVSISKCEQGN